MFGQEGADEWTVARRYLCPESLTKVRGQVVEEEMIEELSTALEPVR